MTHFRTAALLVLVMLAPTRGWAATVSVQGLFQVGCDGPDIGTLIAQVPFGDWIERWVPAWREMLDAALVLTRLVNEALGD